MAGRGGAVRPCGGTEPDVTGDALHRIVREQFRAPDPDLDLRVGVEVEFLCVHRGTRRPAPPVAVPSADGRAPATVPLVADLAAHRGWRRTDGPGLPRFRRPDGTLVSWEPGGQIEIATPPLSSLDAVDAAIADTVSEVATALERAGIGLLARGVDPWTPVTVPRLWLDHPRYLRMSAHYDRGGPAGRRMMRQSAAVHVNLDFGSDPTRRWHRANLLVPAAIAIFANSPGRDGGPAPASEVSGAAAPEACGAAERRTWWRTERGRAWRTLDPSRTGAFGMDDDPPSRYDEFARGALAFLLGDADTPAIPWRETGCEDEPAWRAHLSTLFPEVRPRTYLEVRCVDALRPDHVTLAAAFLAGAVYGSAAPPDVAPPTNERLRVAGRDGLGDSTIREEALLWWEVAREGLVELGPGFASGRVLDRIDDFVATCTRRGRDPGASVDEWVVPQRGSTSVLP